MRFVNRHDEELNPLVRSMIRGALGVVFGFVLAALPTQAAELADAITVQIVRPDLQGERVIDLFKGSRAASPAAALAAWKYAGRGAVSLGKPLEAAIAAFNPGMVREFRGLDGTEIVVGFTSGTGRPHWSARSPNDDGTYAAFTTALALTDGANEEPIGDVPVLRLGPPGSAVSARRDGRLVLASSRDDLIAALDRAVMTPESRAGFHVRLDPPGLKALTTVTGRRLSAGFDAMGCREALGWASLDDETLSFEVTARLTASVKAAPSLDPSWLAAIPATGVLQAVSVALDTRPEALDAVFGVLDRIDRADPARVDLAPLRTRLNLLAVAARVRPEVDLWPDLRGVTFALLVDNAGKTDGAIIALHTNSPDSATRIAGKTFPRLASSFIQGGKVADSGPTLGKVANKPLSLTTRGATVIVGWGETALAAATDAWDHPGRSAGEAIRAAWGATSPQRVGALWPGRLRSVPRPLAQALAEAPPVVWQGRAEGENSRDIVRWSGLRGVIRRWLEALPLETPPDR